jgi:3-dehydroquinate synthase
MWTRDVRIGSGKCQIALSGGLVAHTGPLVAARCGAHRPSSVALVSDSRVAELYADRVVESLEQADFRTCVYRLRPGEGSKTVAELERVYDFLMTHRLGRDGLVVALGGGVVSDLAGLAAATWMRGVDWAVVPTTLVGAIDAAIGGKTAVNLPGGKNLVGAFHQPRFILIDPDVLRTLDAGDIRAGLAESIKHALISSAGLFDWHEQHGMRILELDGSVLTELIVRNIEIKLAIVTKDPLERSGERAFLNLGHTIGHAIEECCGYELRHGECVALGLVAACRLSREAGLLAEPDVVRIERLLAAFGLPTRLASPMDSQRIVQALERDKKVRDGKVRFVLLQEIGRPVVCADVPQESAVRAFESLLP